MAAEPGQRSFPGTERLTPPRPQPQEQPAPLVDALYGEEAWAETQRIERGQLLRGEFDRAGADPFEEEWRPEPFGDGPAGGPGPGFEESDVVGEWRLYVPPPLSPANWRARAEEEPLGERSPSPGEAAGFAPELSGAAPTAQPSRRFPGTRERVPASSQEYFAEVCRHHASAGREGPSYLAAPQGSEPRLDPGLAQAANACLARLRRDSR